MKIGILGGGQLAQMMAIAGLKHGHEFKFLSDDPLSCAAPYGELMVASYNDIQAQDQLAQWADVVTYEFENVPIATIQRIESQVAVHPSSSVLAVAGDRLIEKRLFRTLGIQTATFYQVDNLIQLNEAYSSIGQSAILKTRTEGYDGKGQAVINQPEQLASAWQKIGERPCILEAMVNFSREVSIIAARNTLGEIVFYPLSENIHREGILRLSIARVADPFQQQAEMMIKQLMEHLNYVGIMALELFQVGDDLFANEFAPRVHNSGHWTIEGAATSQFCNHLRAVSGLPLGNTAVLQHSAMVNLIGKMPSSKSVADIRNATLYTYGKQDRVGRKVGHITLFNDTQSEFNLFVTSLKKSLEIAGENDLAKQVDRLLSNSHSTRPLG